MNSKPVFVGEVGGLIYRVVECDRPAVKDGEGKHYILCHELLDYRPTEEEIGQLLGEAWQFGMKSSQGGRFRVAINGPGLATMPHFHVHIIVVDPSTKVMRLTDRIVAP